MIVRVQGDRQYRLDGEAQSRLLGLDDRLVEAVRAAEAEQSHALLVQAIAVIHERGQALTESELAPSDLILPSSDATLDETRDLLQSEGLLG